MYLKSNDRNLKYYCFYYLVVERINSCDNNIFFLVKEHMVIFHFQCNTDRTIVFQTVPVSFKTCSNDYFMKL